MTVRSFQFDSALTRKFIEFGYSLYRRDARRIPPFRRDIARQLSPDFFFYAKQGNDHRHFLAYRDGRVAGRVSAMVNAEIKDDDQTPVGLVGFYECVEDDAIAAALLDAARDWLRAEHRLRRVRGPMNFDFWHGYRFLTRGFDRAPFHGEPDNKPYYPEQFARYGFVPRRAWDSIEINGRETLEALIAPWKKRHEILIGRGYRFVPATQVNLKKEMRTLAELIFRSFGDFPGNHPDPVRGATKSSSADWVMLSPRPCRVSFMTKPGGRSSSASFSRPRGGRPVHERTDQSRQRGEIFTPPAEIPTSYFFCGRIPSGGGGPGDRGRKGRSVRLGRRGLAARL